MKSFYKTTTTFIILLLTLASLANQLTVKQDGTGDHTIIQEAINQATEGDTVLVWPGTYVENINFTGKNITVASLNLTTADSIYKHNTIINGNQNGTCVLVNNGETDAILHGLTITNGSGFEHTEGIFYGGGIYLASNNTLVVINCIITNNFSSAAGGGICTGMYSELHLSGTSIFNNHTLGAGGGLCISYETYCYLDSINRCSIYYNFASLGCDVHKNSSYEFTLFLDSCTTVNPANYFVSSIDELGFQKNDIEFIINHGLISPTNANLYVNPVTGNNENSGLTLDDALQSIAWAYHKIAVDSMNKNTIHIANGHYSDSTNNEKFPLNIRPYINVIGESRNHTVLDGRFKTKLIKGNNEVSNYSFRKMTMTRGDKPLYATFYRGYGYGYCYEQNNHVLFDSILFTNAWTNSRGGLMFTRCANITIRNCEFSYLEGGAGLRMGSYPVDTVFVNNCTFHDHLPDYIHPENRRHGRGISNSGTTIITNSLFYDNYTAMINTLYADAWLINCTFADNGSDSSVGIWVSDAHMNMYNCISFNEGKYPFSVSNIEHQTVTQLDIYNSLIEGAEESIISCGPPWCEVIYDESNIDTNPLFYGGAEFPYNLSDYSPCIDAGTLDIPDWIELPATDLAGNPRIWNGAIDMGAYEWNPTVGYPEFPEFVDKKNKLLSVYPNPFAYETTITVKQPEHGHIKLEVYNNLGVRVKVLMDKNSMPGTSEIAWRGEDENGNQLHPGSYIIVLLIENKEAESIKIIKK
ncbi:MAG: T9SS type A sorting domain-containing protein [Bacteroidetes bacterium]|nr:T9SS type A sorting domain-containing protein [Bacteroidota bacterium]